MCQCESRLRVSPRHLGLSLPARDLFSPANEVACVVMTGPHTSRPHFSRSSGEFPACSDASLARMVDRSTKIAPIHVAIEVS